MLLLLLLPLVELDVGLSARCSMGEVNYTGRRGVILGETLYYSFLLSYLIMVVSALGAYCTCGRCWWCRPFRPLLYGDIHLSLEQGRRDVSYGVDLYNCFLLSYLIMVVSALGY